MFLKKHEKFCTTKCNITTNNSTTFDNDSLTDPTAIVEKFNKHFARIGKPLAMGAESGGRRESMLRRWDLSPPPIFFASEEQNIMQI